MADKEIDVKKLLQINDQNLEEELSSCPSLYYMFSELALEAEAIYNTAVMSIEHHELELANKFKSLHDPKNKTDKITETEIKRMYRGDEKWTLLKTEELKCHMNYKKLEKAAKAFEMKAQSCMSINKRQLYKAGRGMDDV